MMWNREHEINYEMKHIRAIKSSLHFLPKTPKVSDKVREMAWNSQAELHEKVTAKRLTEFNL